MDTFVKNNFGGYVVGLIVVIAAYSAISIWEPKYAAAFAIVTLLGIAMFWLNRQ
jgi:NADH:ubiquinone oxidoreductase subunit 6 (subunit J)